MRLARSGSHHRPPHRASARLVSLSVAGHGCGLRQPLGAPPPVGGAPCLAPACRHHGHPRLRPGVGRSQRWGLAGFALGATRTLVRELCPSLFGEKRLIPVAVCRGYVLCRTFLFSEKSPAFSSKGVWCPQAFDTNAYTIAKGRQINFVSGALSCTLVSKGKGRELRT